MIPDDDQVGPNGFQSNGLSEQARKRLYGSEQSPNYFTKYVKSLIPFNEEHVKPKHIYTISIHPCKFTEELCQFGMKYERTVHKRETVSRDFIQQYNCDVPIYNPKNKEDAERPSYPEKLGIDDHRVFKEEGEGVNPGPGSYMMYHRIDGRMVGMGLIDIGCSQVLNTAYF